MKKFAVIILLILTMSMTSCSQSQQGQATPAVQSEVTSTPETSTPETSTPETNTLETGTPETGTPGSNVNQLSIVRHPSPADFSQYRETKLSELPKYNPDSGEMWQVDIRSADLSRLNLDGRLDDLRHADFDSKTKWPEKLPDGFDPQKIMEVSKNPGLNLRELHNTGITGKGVGLAIIDQTLLVDHTEYKDQLRMYEEIHNLDESAQMHGPAVASIAVGKTVGVAPGANLYYIAETHGSIEQGQFKWDLSWLAKSIDRIVEVNRTLPEAEKIRVISISLGINSTMNGCEEAMESIERAKKEGIYTVYVGSDPFYGLGRDPLADPDKIESYSKGEFLRSMTANTQQLWVPMDSRCTASPTGEDDYVFYSQGGMSWTVPYIAGLYSLACQVKPDITPEVFWEAVHKTSDAYNFDKNSKQDTGSIINPKALIESLKGD